MRPQYIHLCRQRKVSVHTTVTKDTLNKLKNKYGSGSLNEGIENVMKIAETKQFDIKEELLRIANKVLSEYREYKDPFYRHVDIGIKLHLLEYPIVIWKDQVSQ